MKLRNLNYKLLNSFSTSLCYSCKKAYAAASNFNFCNQCYSKVLEEQEIKKKVLKFSYADLAKLTNDFQILEPKIFYFYEYNELIKNFIRDFKFKKPFIMKSFVRSLAQAFIKNLDYIFLDCNYSDFLNLKITDSSKKINLYFATMPMNSNRYKKRGFDQVKVFAEYLFQEIENSYSDHEISKAYQAKNGLRNFKIESFTLLDDLFIRTKDTPSLFHKKREERMEILKNAFEPSYHPKLDKEYENLLIVLDDISTTGLSFLELNKQASELGFDDVFYLAIAGSP